MSHQSPSSSFPGIFESALQDYAKTTNITLATHELTRQLRDCRSVQSVIAFLQDQARELGDFRGSDRIMRSIENMVSVLHVLSDTATFGDAVLPVHSSFPPAEAIQTALAILLTAAKRANTNYDRVVELFESIEHLLKPLGIYTQIPFTPAMDEIVVRIMAELLSALALKTKELKQGRQKNLAKKVFGETDAGAILRRLDRLSHDEARTTAMEILKVVYGLIQDINGKRSVNRVRESLEILHQMASEMNRSRRDQLQKAIRGWLCPPDPWKNHHIARESRHEATAEWFIQGETFTAWRSSGRSSLLWIHGKPGAGKSIFCSTIIEEVGAMRKSGLASLGFFYHDFRDDQKKDRRGLLTSLLIQLCHQSDSYCDILTEFYLEHGNGSQHPNDSALVRCLMDVLKHPRQAPVYLIIDGLDECPNTSSMPAPREKVLELVEELINAPLRDLHICVTSRPEADIKTVLEPLSFRSVSLHDEIGQMEDIENYIKSFATKDPRNRRWKAEDKQLVINVLSEKADGMFRWVYCQAVYLRGCHPGRIRHALSELPETLDETYERTLREINNADWELAHRLFRCVAVASRPLRVDELAEFLAFDFHAGSIAKFQEGWRLEDPVDAVLSTCSTLLALVDVDGSSIIQYSHFSVKEFLTSTRLAEADAEILRRYHISMTPAHALVAQACIGILLHLDTNTTRDDLKKYPLVEYAGRHWVEHARFGNVSQYVEDGMKELFDPRKPQFGIWIWICDPRNPSMDLERAERPSSPRGTPLHYAAVCGLNSIVKFLAIEHPGDVETLCFDDGWTPLHVASAYGHVDVTRVLFEQGADTMARDSLGNTSLHIASREGHVNVARFLVEHGADPTAGDNDGWAPLSSASQNGHVEVARLLIEHGADAMAKGVRGRTALHVASTTDHVEIVRFLVGHGLDVTGRDKEGRTPLHLAIGEGNVKVASFLVEHGADSTARNQWGWTPLHEASAFGYIELARILIKHGADAAIQDHAGQSPLHEASARANIVIARMLVEHGADVTARTTDGRTPLHSASSCGGMEIVRFLVEHGADATARADDGLTPWDEASRMGHVEVARFLTEHSAYATMQASDSSTLEEENQEIKSISLKEDADVTGQSNNGWTPLHLASEQGNMEVVSSLVEQGADATARANDGWTPLHMASSGGSVEVLRILFEHGADTEARADNGWTPLHVASSCGSVEVARFLVDHGADTTAQADDGRIPLQVAADVGNVEVVRILVGHGTDTGTTTAVTAQPMQGSRFFYYVFAFLFFVEIYLHFM